jgi:hypothetical protein
LRERPILVFSDAVHCAVAFSYSSPPLISTAAFARADDLLSHWEDGASASVSDGRPLKKGRAMGIHLDDDLQELRERFREPSSQVPVPETPLSRAAARPTVQLNIRIAGATKAALTDYAERNGVSLAVAITRAVETLVTANGKP